MSDFIPGGHWDFNAAVNAVGKHLYPDEWDWQEPKAPATPSPEDYITGNVDYGDALRRLGTPKEIAGPSDPALLGTALDWLRQRLFKGRLKSYVLTGTGDIKDIPPSEWGTDSWDRVVSSGTVEFMEDWGPVGAPIPGTISGRVLFRIADIDDALRAPTKRGRPRASGSYEKSDMPLIEKMHRLVTNGEANSVWEAACAVAERAKGGGTLESHRKRLAKRYSEKFRK